MTSMPDGWSLGVVPWDAVTRRAENRLVPSVAANTDQLS